MFLELFSRDSVLIVCISIYRKTSRDEKYSGTDPLHVTSPNNFTFQDAGDSFVL